MKELDILKGMASDIRLEILRLLYTRGEMYVTEVAAHIELPMKKICHHMNILRDFGMIDRTTWGTMSFYRITDDKTLELLDVIFPKKEGAGQDEKE